jgi:hypothetical protein
MCGNIRDPDQPIDGFSYQLFVVDFSGDALLCFQHVVHLHVSGGAIHRGRDLHGTADGNEFGWIEFDLPDHYRNGTPGGSHGYGFANVLQQRYGGEFGGYRLYDQVVLHKHRW